MSSTGIRGLAMLAVAGGLLSGCGTLQDWLAVGSSQPAEVVPMPGMLEPVHAAAVVHDQVVFRVSSNGCTAREDLLPVVRQRRTATIVLRRLREDTCLQPVAGGVEYLWSFEEMGLRPGARVMIENPYQMPQT